jgi:hypothetical protein
MGTGHHRVGAKGRWVLFLLPRLSVTNTELQADCKDLAPKQFIVFGFSTSVVNGRCTEMVDMS